MSSIFITAVAGSGKSTVCQVLLSLGYKAYDLESIPGLYELVDENTGAVLPGNLDQIKAGVDWRCNCSELQVLLNGSSDGMTFYCGGMSNTEEVWDLFDTVIVLTVSDSTTASRLSARAPGQFGSTAENREWVLSWKHDFEARLLRLGGIPVSAEAAPEEVAKLVLKATL